MRECYACGSNQTHIDKPKWYLNLGTELLLCNNCYVHLFDKRTRHQQPNTFRFHNRFIGNSKLPRIGVCNWCRAVVPFDCKTTQTHHVEYDELHPESNRIELCASCHMKESHKLGQILNITKPKSILGNG